MSLSKSVHSAGLTLFSNYLQALYFNPVRTKAISSCIIATLGNISSQCITGKKTIDWNNVKAFALFGFFFGGPVPHYFYLVLDKIVQGSSKSSIFKKLLAERLFYAPFFQVLSLYMLARFEGKNSDVAYEQMSKLYWNVLQANWKYLTPLQLFNLWLVPPMLRVLVVNCIGFFWTIYLANKRRQSEAKRREEL